MTNFIRKASIYTILILGLYLIVSFFAGGPSEPLYAKFTGTKKGSMVIGTSRAFMGINPEVIDSVMLSNGDQSYDIYNFAFTEIHSSFGKVYYDAIFQKLDSTKFDQLFIITVDPWAISIPGNIYSVDEYPEIILSVGTTPSFTSTPNFQYLYNAYSQSWGNIITKHVWNEYPERTVHCSGWLEVNEQQEATILQQRIEDKAVYLRKSKLGGYKLSDDRMNYLDSTLKLLKKYGSVHMFRMPVHPLIRQIEDEYMPDFDAKMGVLAQANSMVYRYQYDFIDDLVFFDSHHLESSSAKRVSEEIGKMIITDYSGSYLEN